MKALKKLKGAFVVLAVLFAASASWSAFTAGQPDPVLANAQDKLAGAGKTLGEPAQRARGGLFDAARTLFHKVTTLDSSTNGPKLSPAVAPLFWVVVGLVLFYIVTKVSTQQAKERNKGKGKGR